MKALIIFSLLTVTTTSLAMPYRCKSRELVDGAPVVMFKINPKRTVTDLGVVSERWVVGITPTGKDRIVAYGQGSVEPSNIGMTFVEDGAVAGFIQAYDRGEHDVLEGEFKHYKVSYSTLHVRCLNVAATVPVAPIVKAETKTTFTISDFKILKQK